MFAVHLNILYIHSYQKFSLFEISSAHFISDIQGSTVSVNISCTGFYSFERDPIIKVLYSKLRIIDYYIFYNKLSYWLNRKYKDECNV